MADTEVAPASAAVEAPAAESAAPVDPQPTVAINGVAEEPTSSAAAVLPDSKPHDASPSLGPAKVESFGSGADSTRYELHDMAAETNDRIAAALKAAKQVLGLGRTLAIVCGL